MNARRRKDLQKAIELLQQAYSIIETVQEEEQEAFDNLPEGIQYSESGERMEENVSTLEDIASTLEEAIDNIETVME